jgi:hypothetical protein
MMFEFLGALNVAAVSITAMQNFLFFGALFYFLFVLKKPNTNYPIE